jgi:hypothetical protein
MPRLSTSIDDQISRNMRYGVQETNPVGDIHHYLDRLTGETVELSDERLVKIERLRLIGWTRELPVWDVSYVYGRLSNGDLVRVDLGSHQYYGPRMGYNKWLVGLCKAAGKYGKTLGIFDAVSTLNG